MLRKILAMLAGIALTGGLSAPALARPAPLNPAASKSFPAITPEGTVLDQTKPSDTPRSTSRLKGRPSASPSTSLTACGSPPCYRYAGSMMSGLTDDSDGIGATVLVSKPYKNTSDDPGHTLVELSAQDTSSNIVEVGWRVAEDEYGDSNPHLFAYWWVNGTGQGYDAANGFQNVAGCNPCAGGSLSAAINTNKQFGIQYFASCGVGCTPGWWLSYNGNYIGVYPSTGWTSPTFTAADRVDAFGEVAGAYTDTCTDMGSGHAGGGANSTLIQNLDLPGSTDAEDFDNAGNLYQTASAAWNVVGTADTSIRPGGPGYNSIGGTPGAIGSCAPSSAGTPAASSMQLWAEFCPDGQTSTGCNNTLGTYNTTSAPLNTCVALSLAQYQTTVFQNNSGVSGRSYQIWATAGCTGATSLTIGNGGSGNPSFEPHGIKRTG